MTEAERGRSYNFGFAHYLDMAAGAYENVTLPVVAAFEAMKGAYEVAGRERSVDVDVYFDCAVQACSRLGGAAPASPCSSRVGDRLLHGEAGLAARAAPVC
ncbi:hypothetical protein ACIO02_23240 [Streptomyces sp. NPDC087568]|uniref:hypothetical protein n=1 Tax=Streptomyces sp. NPDC087568 TaxID=3365799 RepID=UPI00380A7B2C